MKTVALIAPASPCPPAEVAAAVSFFEAQGFHVRLMPHAGEADRFMAGSDTNRAQDIMDAFLAPDIDLIVSLRGGYGTPRLLNKLDYKRLAKYPKPFFGFSDTTALQLALWHKADLPSFSGFQGSFVKHDWPHLMQSLNTCLNGDNQTITGLMPLNTVQTPVQGPLIGGTLTLINALVGTPYLPNPQGAIVFLEEVGEQPYHIDRLLNQLFLSGFFDHVGAVLLGGFHKCVSKDPADGTVEEVLNDRFAALSVPVMRGLPYTHGADHLILPMGGTGLLTPKTGVLSCPAPLFKRTLS